MIELNGKTTGFFVEVEDNNTKKYITTSSGIRIFDNLEIAKVTANRFVTDQKFSYHIRLEDQDIPLADTQYIGDGVYQAVDKDGNLIDIKELRRYTTTSLGYLIFRNGDKLRIAKEEGFAAQKDLMKVIKWAFEVILLNNTNCCGITKLKKRRGEFVASIRGTSSKIHVLRVNRLMELNQERKEAGLHAFPFRKEVDKYCCFYIYTTKDISESKNLRGESRTKEVLNTFIDLISTEFKEIPFKYEAMETSRFVQLSEED